MTINQNEWLATVKVSDWFFKNFPSERDKFEKLLKSSSEELHNFELFKQNIDEEKLQAVEDVQNSMKAHYAESLKEHLQQKEKESLTQIELLHNDHRRQIESLEQKITSVERANDEIKNDYCKLAAEKETYERHYEKLERLNQEAERDKKSLTTKIDQLQNRLTITQKATAEPPVVVDASSQTETKVTNLVSIQTDPASEGNETINKLKAKFRRESQSWAKEKRRLESKIRHAETSNTTNDSSSSVTPLSTPRSEVSDSAVCDEKEMQEKLNKLKSEYLKTISNIQTETKITIDELRERHRAKVKQEVSQAQRRISEKLHAQYKSLLNNIVEPPRA